jgi:hypothetical protein
MREHPVSDEVEALFEEVDEIVKDILSYCEVFDSIYHATGIYQTLRTISGQKGEHVWEDKEFEYKKKDGTTFKEPVKVYKEYIPKDEEEHNIVIVDNLNNLGSEYDSKLKKRLDIREAISRWARDYSRLQIVKHWNWTVWNIMQTSLETDRKQFDLMRGKQVIEKVEPNLNSLGDNKTVSRDMHLIFGIFVPDRFNIEEYEGYDITKMQDTFRSLIILKSNFSITNKKLPLYFNGACSYYEELPPYNEINYDNYK